jgi:hypothetical protein
MKCICELCGKKFESDCSYRAICDSCLFESTDVTPKPSDDRGVSSEEGCEKKSNGLKQLLFKLWD